MTALAILSLFAWLVIPPSLWIGWQLWKTERPKSRPVVRMDEWRRR